MARIAMLGCGMVGATIALDLARRHEVVAADRDPDALAGLVARAGRAGTGLAGTRELDASDPAAVRDVVAGADLAISAVPGALGRRVLEAVIGAGVDACDIAFGPENVLDLDGPARARGVCAVVDIGVAPGLASVILGHRDRLWVVHQFECLVGGLPTTPAWPWRYRAPFSPADVVEEYVRPARLMVGGEVVVREALSDPEWVDFPGVGTLEAFNTDGLRSLLTTMRHVPNMRERTLRWPGHRELAHVLRETGLLALEPITVADSAGSPVQVAPREVTSQLLFRHWAFSPGETEFTAMQVSVSGTDRDTGDPRQVVYRLIDRTDTATGTSSMARTTGYTCVAAAELVLSGAYRVPGIHPGEHLGAVPGVLDRILGELATRGVTVTRDPA